MDDLHAQSSPSCLKLILEFRRALSMCRKRRTPSSMHAASTKVGAHPIIHILVPHTHTSIHYPSRHFTSYELTFPAQKSLHSMAGAIETIKAGDSIDTRVKKIIVFCLDCSNDQVCQISFPCTLPASCPWDDAPSKLDASGKFPAQVADFRALQVTNDAGFELDLQAASADLDDAQNILCEEFQIDIPDDIFEKVDTGKLLVFFAGMNVPGDRHVADD